MIPYGKHFIDQDDIDAVVDVLQNHNLTQGPKVPEFETALCHYTGAQFCTTVNSATSGLHIACLSLGIGTGDIVWTVPNSFAASANCALYCGASVDFVDISPVTFNICVDSLKAKVEQAKELNCLPHTLIVVHFAGTTCDMQSIHDICRKYGINIVEDAAHSIGASYREKKVGCCEFSDMTVLSFHPVKSMTTAEGGAVLTNSAELNQKLILFSKHGITRDPALMTSPQDGPWHYQQIALGFNYRLNDIQAALGISQLKKLDGFMEKRRKIAQRYFDELAHLPLTLPSAEKLLEHSWHLFMVVLNIHDRSDVYRQLHNRGIGVNVHYIPIHTHPFYQQLGFKTGDFPHSEHFYNNALTLPIYPSLTASEQGKVIESLNSILS
ncbi:UDP-4-amino-4,6-dideoxy-N-acetyl-beta-L-altrosamine transaminase [Glaciecola sp. KUL10]|uniref:UDP-4-amino-4, 6-dideoxy-N-acetyl-beta-L-altrosamine transaminase n=1 Tax=Glaciecola sp. (strain KUL10) TaxID=2161813 RepID=UPI000D784C6D|nr:UDP-4-amino-4,6-dideoxy-N-acetyl-beta-L-altrosamine transaminase [Glaciecola sp. KUL10]GBL04053.1 DegT/DnrJ/EryC1/StrS aminotransferase [Glaciecola sp. KUL10]